MSAADSTLPAPDAARPLRADAQRNRDAVIAAARAALAGAGATLSLDAVARNAGVGIGTLYRHFPTRASLIETVYAAELDELADSPADLLSRLSPDAALRDWVHRYARFVAVKRGMADTLKAGLDAGRIIVSTTRERVREALRPMLEAGAHDGTLRDDVSADDVTSLLLGTFLASTAHGDPDVTIRLLDLVLDGLRPMPERRSEGN